MSYLYYILNDFSLCYEQFIPYPTMVIGRRSDVLLAHRRLFLPKDVEYVALSEGKLHTAGGIDYFAIARNDFPWHHYPDLIIGRPSYDNFLVATASLNNVSVVDATRTVVALHQTDTEGIGSGHRRIDSNYNRRIIFSRYTEAFHSCSHIDCTKYITKLIDRVSQNALRSNTSRLPERYKKSAIVVVLRSYRKS